ncbi:MAG: hypothetical protein AAF399_17105 [Bacteroidota bacterium]
MEPIKHFRLLASLSGIPLAELMAMLPSVDTFTTWVKLLVQFLLLITALLQAHSIWLEKRRKSK